MNKMESRLTLVANATKVQQTGRSVVQTIPQNSEELKVQNSEQLNLSAITLMWKLRGVLELLATRSGVVYNSNLLSIFNNAGLGAVSYD